MIVRFVMSDGQVAFADGKGAILGVVERYYHPNPGPKARRWGAYIAATKKTTLHSSQFHAESRVMECLNGEAA